LTFYSSLPVAVAALRTLTNEGGDLIMTTLPVTSPVSPTANASVVFPHFAGGGWSTQVILVNPTDAPLAGTLQFLISLNGMTDSEFDYTVPPRSSLRFTTPDAGSRVQSGYVLATAKGNDAVPEGISIFSVSDHGETVSETAVSAGPPGTDFQTYVDRMENRRF